MKVVSYLLNLIRGNSVDSILRSFRRHEVRLERLHDAERRKAAIKADTAQRLQLAAAGHHTEADRAARVQERLRELVR